MQWEYLQDNYYDMTQPEIYAAIQSLTDIGSGYDVLDVACGVESKELADLLVEKAILLKAKFTHEDFAEFKDIITFEVFESLAKYTGHNADYPEYNKDDRSWDHFYDNCTEWPEEILLPVIERLRRLGNGEAVADAVLSMKSINARTALVRKAIAVGTKFKHEDFWNIENHVPDEVYEELADHAGFFADCPCYDSKNQTWKYFYEESCCWPEKIQLLAMDKLKTFGKQNQVAETIMGLDSEVSRTRLAEMAIQRSIIFSRENLVEIEILLPEDVFAQLLSLANIPADDLYFDEDNMTWDDFYSSYSDWDEQLLARRIRKLKDFGPSEEICEVIQGMPTFELEEAIYKKAISKGVVFTEEELDEIGRVEYTSV